jgi:signal transduction histidine kinase
MRLRIILLAAAISSMILVSFLVPLALLLRTFQADRAVSAATVQAEDMAPLVATLDTQQLRQAVNQVNAEDQSQQVTIFLPGDTTLGPRARRSAGVQLAATRERSLTDQVPGGTEVLVAVSGLPRHGTAASDTAVIRTFVPRAQLRHGVLRAWLLLGGVGLGLVALSVIVSAQLARSLVRPLRALALASEQLAAGDLSARAPFEGAPEIRKVSLGLNRLAVRIGELLAHERETVADMSHRLRTPLTALRIDAESLRDKEEMTRVIAGVDDLSRTINEIIREARRPTGPDGQAACNVVGVVAERTAFWRPLAEDQDRRMTVDLPDRHLPVLVPVQDMSACLDILLENVFAHTPEGTAFSVRARRRARGGAWLVVSDDGPGFTHPDPARRGLSSGGSTGLGLDIVHRIAEASGGTLTLGRSPAGGAAVTVGFGPTARPERQPRRHVRARPHLLLPGHRLRAERDTQLSAELSVWAAISGRDLGGQ